MRLVSIFSQIAIESRLVDKGMVINEGQTVMMDQEVKAKWVAALRSGEYKQGTGRLECNGENCCLGVLARITDVPATESGFETNATEFDFGNEFRSRVFPPDDFCGLTGSQIGQVANLNDIGRKTFEEIADHIEANF